MSWPYAGSGLYRRRVVDTELDELMAGLPAISLEGPKGVGKTATASQRARTVYSLDDATALEVVRADYTRLARGDEPILIDEWQRYEPSRDLVRRAVDDHDVKHLLWLRDHLGDRCADTVVLHTGPYAYRRADGVAVVPLALLGP